jgi:hypothetical protein
MSTTSIVAIVVAAISAIAAVFSAWLAAHTVRSERLAAADQIALRFRGPLLQAAFNLQTAFTTSSTCTAAFVERVSEEPMNRWFKKLRSDLDILASESNRTARLIEIQHGLLDLIRSIRRRNVYQRRC